MTSRNEPNKAAATHDSSTTLFAPPLSDGRLEAGSPVRAARKQSTSSYGPVDLSLESMVCLGVTLTRRRRPEEGLCL